MAGGYRPDVIAQSTNPSQLIRHNGPISAIFVVLSFLLVSTSIAYDRDRVKPEGDRYLASREDLNLI